MSAQNLLAMVWVVDLGAEPDADTIPAAVRTLQSQLEATVLPSGARVVIGWVGVGERAEEVLAAIPLSAGMTAPDPPQEDS